MLENDQIDEKGDLKIVVDFIISWNVHTSLCMNQLMPHLNRVYRCSITHTFHETLTSKYPESPIAVIQPKIIKVYTATP